MSKGRRQTADGCRSPVLAFQRTLAAGNRNPLINDLRRKLWVCPVNLQAFHLCLQLPGRADLLLPGHLPRLAVSPQ